MRITRITTVAMLVLSVAALPLFAAESPAKEKKEGAAIFKTKCASCHGPEGSAETTMAKNMKIRPLHSAEVQKQTKAEIVKIIEDGKGKMPAYKSKLSKDEIQDVADYIKSLKK